jgi:hypothetical protein
MNERTTPGADDGPSNGLKGRTTMDANHDGAGGATDFERRARERLVASADELDGRTRSRLTQARHAALAEVQSTSRPFRVPGFWLPAGALACAAVLAVTVWIDRAPGPATATVGASAVVSSGGSVEDLAILASADSDMYAEDPDFYEWAGSDEATEATRG